MIGLQSIRIEEFKGGTDLAEHIARLHLKVREWQVEQGQSSFPKGILSSQEDLYNLENNYIKKGGNFFLARNHKGRIAGFIAVRNDGLGVGSIKRMAVLPEFHRQGIASTLLSVAIDWSKKAGYKKLVLSTGKRENGKPLYEKSGFVVVGSDYTIGDHLMELIL